MHYIDQHVNHNEPLETSSQVHAILTSEREDGEIDDVGSPTDILDISAEPPDWDDYGVLAVSQKPGTPRYTIPLHFGSNEFEFMVDTGSPT